MSDGNRVRNKVITATVLNGQATATGATTLLNGVIRSICINVPVTLTSATYTIAITGPATGFTLFSKSGISGTAGQAVIVSDGTAGNLPVSGLAVDTASNITITTASNEGAQRVFTATLLIER